MSSILVLEPEPRAMERIQHALGAEGWRVRTVQDPSQILQAVASDAPDLVILDAGVAGAEAVTGALSRSAGGPGVLVLVPDGASGLAGADEVLARSADEPTLREAVRRAVVARRAPAPAAQPVAAEAKLTSLDIFGDVLAEVEGDAPAPRRPAAPSPPPAPAPAPRPAAPPRQDEDVQRRLEKTLSGVLGTEPKPRPAAPPPVPPPAARAAAPPPLRPAAPPAPRRPEMDEADIDAILSRTLSSVGAKPRPVAPAPPAAALPAAAPPPAPPRPAAAAPAPPVQENTAVRKAPRPLDQGLAELEELARGVRRPEAASPVREATKSGVTPPAVQRPAAPPPVAPVPVAPPPAAQRPAAPPPPRPAEPAPAVPPPAPPSAPPLAPRPEPGAPIFEFGEIPSLPDLPEPVLAAEPVPEPDPGPVLLAPELPPPAPIARAAPIAPIPPPPPAAPVRVTEDVAATQRIPVFAGDETLDQPGERFGQYTLLEKIAAGGMAEVWKARMRGVEGFQKTVAIKKILPYMTDNSEFIGMFIDEAKLAAQLGHPNIVHIYDLGKIGRDYYIAMEYVEGKDLRSILNAAWRKHLWMPLGLGLLIGSRLASALDYAHRKRDFEGRELGLVHRDVSPQNVLISYEGDVKLCDFGIAKAVSKVGQTQMGALKGKLQYMSPEQAWGRPIDARSDIFSLGAVLFEMLTGERLFSGESEMSVLEAVRQGHVRHVRQIDPLIPTEVEAIVDRALAYEPQDRFQSAGELAQRLEEVLHNLTPAPGPTDLAAWVRRALEPGEEVAAEPEVFPPSAAPPRFAPEPMPAAAPFPSFEPEPAEAVAAVAPIGEVRVEEGTGRRSRVLLYAAIVVLILVVVFTLFVLNRPRGGAGNGEAPAPQTGPGPAAQAPAGPAPQLPAQVPVAPTAPQANPGGAAPVDMQGLVNEELAKREEELRRQYEERQKKIEQQLAAKGAKEGTPAPAAVEARPAPRETPPPAAAVAPPAVPEPTPAQAQVEPPRPVPQSEPEPERTEPNEPEPEVRVRTGDLVAGGPGVKPPELVSAPKPQYPPMARQLRAQGIVVVSVLVDENGQVQDVRVIETNKENQKVGFNEAAVAAARSARYRPATKDGTRVKMWTRLRIPFKL